MSDSKGIIQTAITCSKPVVYLSNTGFGKAMYMYNDGEHDIICPRIEETPDDATIPVSFFPKYFVLKIDYSELREQFQRRLSNSDDNRTFLYGGFILPPKKVKPLPVKRKFLERFDLRNLDDLITRICKSSDGRGRFDLRSCVSEDFSLDHENLRKMRKNLECGLTCISLLEEYHKLYDEFYASAEWVGSSESADRWYKKGRH